LFIQKETDYAKDEQWQIGKKQKKKKKA